MAGKKQDLTQEDVLAWADGIVGTPAQKTADKLGIHRNTVAIKRKKVADFVAKKFDINKYRLPLYGLYPLWLNSTIHNLKKNDVTMTIAIGKGLSLLVDKQEIDAKGNLTGLSNDELAERIIDALKATASHEG